MTLSLILDMLITSILFFSGVLLLIGIVFAVWWISQK